MSEQFHMRDKLKFQDRREMQLFAEQVLRYRLPDKQFHSFGYHQPNTEEQRQVYTITDHTLYYFLPEVSRNAVTNAIFDIRKILQENPLMEINGQVNAIKTAVLLGDSSPEAVSPRGLTSAEYRAEIQQFLEDQMFQTGRSASHPIANLDMGLSYLNDDVYWDVRRDRIAGESENGYRTPVTDVLTAIKTAPTEVLTTSPPIDRPRYMRQPIGDTTPTAVPVLSPVDRPTVEPVVPAMMPVLNPDIPLRSERSERAPLNWWENTSSLALLAAITLAGLLTALGLISLFKNPTGPEIATNNITSPPASPSRPATTVVPLNGGSPPIGSNGTTPKPAPAIPAPATPAPATPAPATPAPQLPMLLVQSPSGNFNAVNLREGPGTNFASLGAIRQGNYVVDRAEQSGDWRRVSYFNKTGWVYMPFIR